MTISELPDGEELVGAYLVTNRGRRLVYFNGSLASYGPLEEEDGSHIDAIAGIVRGWARDYPDVSRAQIAEVYGRLGHLAWTFNDEA